jgi:hypothetical protein
MEAGRPKVSKKHLQYAIEYHAELDRAFAANLLGGVFSSAMNQCIHDLTDALPTAGIKGKDFAYQLVEEGLLSIGWIARRIGERTSFKNLKAEAYGKYKSPRDVAKLIAEHACDEYLLQASVKPNKFINLLKGH